MYREGEEKYLKDLDWVNIVKSIRELKALTRIILDQQQRQILSFERESVLPSNKCFEEQDANQIQNKLPFEYDDQTKHQEYYEELDKFIEKYSERKLSAFDRNIITELTDEVIQPIQDVTVQNSSAIGGLITEQRDEKWD